MYHISIIYSYVHGHLEWSYSLALDNEIAININVYCICVCTANMYILRTRVYNCNITCIMLANKVRVLRHIMVISNISRNFMSWEKLMVPVPVASKK